MWPFKKKPKKKLKKVGGFIYAGNNTQVKSTPKNYEQFANETYIKNLIAFRCIDYRAKSFGSVPWFVYNKNSEEKVKNHNFQKIFEYPNVNDGWSFFAYKELSYRLISGNTFTQGITVGSKINSETIKELWLLRPDKMNIICTDGLITGYKYTKDSSNPKYFDVDPITGESEIMQIALFNPLDDFWGMAPTIPASREIDSSNEATNWNLRMMQNEGRPGMMVTVEGSLTEEQFDRLENQLKTMYSGSQNAGRSLILEGIKTEAKPYNWSPKEMDWLETNREMSRKICLAYGVPPLLINIPGDSTYNNYKEARQAFWEDTVVSDLNLYKSELNRWLFKDSNFHSNFDLSGIPAFVEKENQKWERAEKSSFLTINEKRQMVNKDPVPDGDVILVAANLLPLGTSTIDDDLENSKNIKQLKQMGYSELQAKKMLGIIND